MTSWTITRRTFRAYFRACKLSLPRSLSRGHGVISGCGWHIVWTTRTLRGRAYLDFYAKHRMTNDRHHRIRQDGNIVELPTAWSSVLFPLDYTAVDKNNIERRWARRNDRIHRLVHAKFRDIADPGTNNASNE